MKTTPFTHFHEALGARMAPFAGYNMPIEYSGIKDEHLTVREKAGVFDVSHMGEFWIKGPKAFDLVQKLTSNDVAALTDGKVQYSCFPNETGGIVDDLLVYRFSAEKYLLVVNAANIEKDWNHVVKYAEEMGMKPGVDLENTSDDICQLAIQGPLALKIMQKLTKENVTDMEYYTFKEIPFAGIDKVIFSTTGYTGSGGCEVYAYNKDADKLWNAIFEAGQSSVSSRSVWEPGIPCVWKPVSVCTDMKSTTNIHRLKPVWAGLPSLYRVMISSTVLIMKN